MAGIETLAAKVRPPLEGNIRVVAITTTSAATDISEFAGQYVTFQAQGGDVFIVFADSGAVADNTATTGDTRCAMIPVGTSKDFFLIDARLSAFTHFAAETASGTATLRYWLS
jgi:hypothetical protein